MGTEDQADQTVMRIDAALEQIRREGLRQIKQNVGIVNKASAALGVPGVVVILRSDEVMTTTCSAGT